MSRDESKLDRISASVVEMERLVCLVFAGDHVLPDPMAFGGEDCGTVYARRDSDDSIRLMYCPGDGVARDLKAAALYVKVQFLKMAKDFFGNYGAKVRRFWNDVDDLVATIKDEKDLVEKWMKLKEYDR